MPIALGAYIAGAPDNPALLDQFVGMIGTPPAIVMWYQDWVRGGFDWTRMNAIAARGSLPLVTWEPWDPDPGADWSAHTLAKINGGNYDDYLYGWADDAAQWGKPCFLRFAHEMNANWYPWGAGVNGNTPEEYVAAWRRVVGIFRAKGATNVRWVWCPNVADPARRKQSDAARADYRAFYPGDAFVDWIGMDGYNWGASQAGTHWQSLETIFGETYAALTALTNRPLMIGETASAEEGGDKAAWIAAGFRALPAAFPRVRAVVWFSEAKEADWRVNSSDAALAAYRGVAQSALYRGKPA